VTPNHNHKAQSHTCRKQKMRVTKRVLWISLAEVNPQPNHRNSLKAKVNYCFVCEKPQTKFARHLERHVKSHRHSSFPNHQRTEKVFLRNSKTLATSSINSIVKTTGLDCFKVKRNSKQSSSSETYKVRVCYPEPNFLDI